VQKILQLFLSYVDRFADVMYGIHLPQVLAATHPVVLALLGMFLLLLLYGMLGSAISLHRLRKKLREQTTNADRMSRELAREKRQRLDYADRCKEAQDAQAAKGEECDRIRFISSSLLACMDTQAWFLDGNAKFLSANRCQFGSHTAQPDDVAGKSVLELFGETASELHQLVIKAANTRMPLQSFKIDAFFENGPGQYNLDIHPLFDDERRSRGLLVMLRDESDALEATMRHENILRRMDEGLLIVQDDVIRYANPRLEQMGGFSKDELLDTPLETLIDTESTKPWKPELTSAVWNPLNLRMFTSELTRADGEKAQIRYILGYTRWNGREADLLFVDDLEALVRLERGQQESLAVLNTTLDAIDQGVVATDANGAILHYNHRLLSVWDLSEAIFTQRKWDSVLNAMKVKVENPQEYEAWLQEMYVEGGNSREITLRNGKVLEFSLHRYSMGAENSGRVISFLDVTDVKKRERELQEARDQAENNTQVKSEFLAKMSHEIRTPMNGIIGVVTLMERSQLNHRQRRYMDVIRVSADSLLNLINDILDFSKIEAGYLKLEKIDFDLPETIGSAADLLALKAQSKGIELLTWVRPDVPNLFRGDPNRLRQILINLGNNAIKFTEKGQIVIHCQVDSVRDNDYVLHFVVSDTGAGIKPDKLDTIFEKYEQEEVSTARQFGGTGLGLTICKNLVELMHGRIWVESQYGQGSDFHFTIRLRNEDDPRLEREIEQFSQRKPRLLIAVRNAVNKSFIAETLRYYGVECTVIETPDLICDALEASVRSHEPFHALLTEPFGDTYVTVARKMAKSRKLLDVQTVLLVSFAESSSLTPPEDVHIAEMMNLPLKRPELLQTIRRVLGMSEMELDEAAADAAGAPAQSYRILLAEDNPINQGVVTEILESEGHAVVAAGTGEEVLRQLGQNEFDLVFMDVHMPVMDGLEATRLLREQEAGARRLPVVAMTADVLSDDRDKCLAAGMDDFITKPLKLDDLRRVLRRVMRAQHAAESAPEPEEERAGAFTFDIDMNHVRETLGGSDKVILKTFDLIIKKFPQSRQELTDALNEKDAPRLHRAAHGMKGFINYFDVPDLLDLIHDMEKAGKKGDLKRGKQLMIDLEPLLDEFLAALVSKRDELTAGEQEPQGQ